MTTALPPAPLTESDLEIVLEDRLSDARTLPASAYLSPDILEWERKHLLESAWVCVGRSSDIGKPGDQKAVDVGTQGILLTRDEAGTLRAFYNACRHRGHELLPVGECTNKRLVQCAYHAWVYALDGELRSATQFMDQQNFNKEEWPLLEVRAIEWYGWIFINASGDAPEFREWVGNLTEVVAPWDPTDMVLGESHSYVLKTNWKTVIENYMECYHCPSIHPELCRVSPPESAVGLHQTGMWLGGGLELRDDADTNSLDGRGDERLAGLNDEQARWTWYFMLAPNLLLTLQPDYVMTHRLVPVSPGETFVECSWYFPKHVAERPDFDPSFAANFWDITNKQDFGACESVYKGMLTDGYRPGPFDEREDGVRAFQAQLATAYKTGRWERPLQISLGAPNAV